MKLFSLIFVLISTINILNAQSKTDSLIQKLTVAAPSEKAEIYGNLCWELKFSDFEKALDYGQKAIDWAQKSGDLKKEGIYLSRVGVVYAINGNYRESNRFSRQAISLFQKISNAVGIGNALNTLGLNFEKLGEYDSSLMHFNRALDVFNLMADSAGAATIIGNIGNVEFRRGNYEKALENYLIGYENAIRIDDKNKQVSFLGNMARCHQSVGEFAKAAECFYRSNEMADSINNHYSKALNFNSLGLIFSKLNLFEEAFDVYHKALKIFRKLGNANKIGVVNYNIGKTHLLRENYDSAYIYFNITKQIYDSLGVKSVGNVLRGLAIIHDQNGEIERAKILLNQTLEIDSVLGEKDGLALSHNHLGELALKTENFALAQTHLKAAQHLFSETKEIEYQQINQGLLAILFEKKGDLEKAIFHKNRATILKDSLYKIEKINEFNRIRTRKTIEERDENWQMIYENSESKTSEKSNKAGIFILAICLMLGGWYFLKNRDKKAENSTGNEQMKYQLEKQNLEMTYLSLSNVQKETFLKKLKTELENQLANQPKNAALKELKKSFDIQNIGKENWDFFRDAFQKLHPHFFEKLKADYPNLTAGDLRLCALIRLNVPPSEIASVLAISVNSLHKGRYRLRKKLGLKREDKLEIFLERI